MDGSPSALEIDKPQKGTMVSVRNIHKSVKSVQATYKKFRENHYENAIIQLNEYSMILKDIELNLTNEFVLRKGEHFKK